MANPKTGPIQAAGNVLLGSSCGLDGRRRSLGRGEERPYRTLGRHTVGPSFTLA